MRANYHIHTWRCGHAKGTEREYIERAIQSGMEILGFADHGPYPFPGGYISDFRMTLNQAEDYFKTLLALKKEYSGQIELHIGVEVEYYPKWHEGMINFLQAYPCEYLLLGQHFLGYEPQKDYCTQPHTDVQSLRRYVEQVLEGLRLGCFACLAHPDILNWEGDMDIYRREMLKLCKAAKDLEIPLEINLLGLQTGRHYPNEAFWQIAGEVGCAAVLGCDAHSPQGLDLPEIEQQARVLTARNGLHLVEKIPF